MGIRKYKTRKGELRYGVNVNNKLLGKQEWVGTFKTADDAKRAFVEADRRIRMGELLPKRKDIGFTDLVDKWMETLTVRKTTRDEYRHTTAHLRDYFGSKSVCSIGKEDVQRFVAAKVSAGYSDRYVRKMVTRLSQVLNVAVEWGYISVSPTAGGVRNLPREPRRQVKPLSSEEVRALLDAAPDFWRPAILTAISCGLRRSELFGLTVDDLDLEAGLLHVRGQMKDGKREDYGKTQNAMRSIPVPGQLADALVEHLKVVPATPERLLFPTEKGFPVTGTNWYRRVWKPTVRKAGLRENLTLHDLRKQYASVMVRKGRSAAFLQAAMGHSSAVTTLSWYVGVFLDEQKHAAQDMEEWLSEETRTLYVA